MFGMRERRREDWRRRCNSGRWGCKGNQGRAWIKCVTCHSSGELTEGGPGFRNTAMRQCVPFALRCNSKWRSPESTKLKLQTFWVWLLCWPLSCWVSWLLCLWNWDGGWLVLTSSVAQSGLTPFGLYHCIPKTKTAVQRSLSLSTRKFTYLN